MVGGAGGVFVAIAFQFSLGMSVLFFESAFNGSLQGGAGGVLCVSCCLCGSSKESVVIFFMLDQKCVIFNWNVRGLNNAARRQVVFNSARDYSATIVALQETKLANIDRQVVFEVLGSRFVDNFLVLPADGTRGGILLAVDEY
jgi:hypothetical protein